MTDCYLESVVRPVSQSRRVAAVAAAAKHSVCSQTRQNPSGTRQEPNSAHPARIAT